jgi:hypothetical protein
LKWISSLDELQQKVWPSATAVADWSDSRVLERRGAANINSRSPADMRKHRVFAVALARCILSCGSTDSGDCGSEKDSWHIVVRANQSPIRRHRIDANRPLVQSRNVRLGDEVWILFGCPMPIVLRPNPSKRAYTLVGCAVIPGLMNGEACEGISENGDVLSVDYDGPPIREMTLW